MLPDFNRDIVEQTKNEILDSARRAVEKSISQCETVLAYSGGVDSALLVKLVLSANPQATLLSLGREDSSDVRAVKHSDPFEKADLVIGKISEDDIRLAAKKVIELSEVSTLPHFEDCVAFWLLADRAVEIGKFHGLASANGPDELFCGYDRFRRILDEEGYDAVDAEILAALDSADRLGSQGGSLLSEFGLRLCNPFLDKDFRGFCLKVSSEMKILRGNDLLRKRIWRYAGASLGLPQSIVLRPKKAMQYGMGIHSVISNMLKEGSLSLEIASKNK